jgi:hypothetical protein
MTHISVYLDQIRARLTAESVPNADSGSEQETTRTDSNENKYRDTYTVMYM